MRARLILTTLVLVVFPGLALAQQPAQPVTTTPAGHITVANPTFVWTEVATATHYQFYVSNTSGKYFAQWLSSGEASCGAGTCSFVIPQLIPNGSYRWWVQARSLTGYSPWSVQLDFVLSPFAGKPGAVTLVAPTGVTGDTTPDFVWNHVAEATGYYLWVNGPSNGLAFRDRYLASDICAGATCTVPASLSNVLLVEGPHQWWVQPSNEYGDGPWGTPIGFNVSSFPEPPPRPVLIGPDGGTPDPSPRFEWQHLPTATEYYLWIGAGQGSVFKQWYAVDATLCPNTTCAVVPNTILPEGRYIFWIQAKNSAGLGPWSQPMVFAVGQVTGLPGKPTLVAPSGTSSATPTFTWVDDPNAEEYYLWINGPSGNVHKQWYPDATNCDGTNCAIQVPNLALVNGAHVWWVQAQNVLGRGPWSSGMAFTVGMGGTPPGPTSPVSPSGTINVNQPTYVWNTVNTATHYTLFIENAALATIFQQRYPASDVNCASTCSVAPAFPLQDGDYGFRVMTENAIGNGPLSVRLPFKVSTNSVAAVRVTSHNEGDNAPDNGFILSGDVDADVATLSVSLDANGQQTINQMPLQISATNKWDLFVQPMQVVVNAPAVFTLVTTDAQNQSTTLVVTLNIVPFDMKAEMLLSRATFGATPAMREEVATNGSAALQDRLLNPVPDADFNAFVAALPRSTEANLREYAVLHALFNPNQLQEVMTQFWDNHFSTDHDTHDTPSFEFDENDGFRAMALGRFRNLLELSAKSPAMLIYLNQTESTAAEPNENYARELLELHTFGVNGGYTQGDIEELARILTGWKEQNGQFIFDGSDHDSGIKTVLGVTYPTTPQDAGVREGEQVLDFLAAHQSTANFICSKLIEAFVSEEPPSGLVASCASVFLTEHNNNNPNQMREVVAHILDSGDFANASNYRAKVKTPLEFLSSAVRALEAKVADNSDPEAELRQMGMNLFNHSTPDGFSETADDWVDTSLVLDRVNFVNELAREAPNRETWLDLRQYFLDRGYETAEGIVGYLFSIAFAKEYSDTELSIAFNIMTLNGTSAFDIDAADAESRLQRLVGTVLSFPGFLQQ